MHGLGTLALGAGIFLAGQIFNLEEHWPGGIMLWAAGAWIGYALLRDWVQGVLAALLTPFWLSGEWIEATKRFDGRSAGIPLAVGVLLLAVAYVSARRDDRDRPLRRGLGWIGGIAMIPAAAVVAVLTHLGWDILAREVPLPGGLAFAGWSAAIAIPLGLSFLLRGREAWTSALAMAWGVLLAFLHPEASRTSGAPQAPSGSSPGVSARGGPSGSIWGLQVSPSRCSLSIFPMSWTSSAVPWA